jgi:hypothetical protein
MAGDEMPKEAGQWMTHYRMRCDGCGDEFVIGLPGSRGRIPILVLCPNPMCQRAYTVETDHPVIRWIDAPTLHRQRSADDGG